MIVTSIQINSNEELYTDLDIQVESRKKKLSLLGIDPYSQVYTLDDIPKIFELSDRVILHGATTSTGAYKFAFEDVFSRIKNEDISKLYVRTVNRKLDWNITDVDVNYGKVDIKRFKHISNFYNNWREDRVSRPSDFWYIAFLLAWYKLYKTKDKTDTWDSYRKIEFDKAMKEEDWYRRDYLLNTRLSGAVFVENDSSIIHNYSLKKYRNPSYKFVTFNVDTYSSAIFLMKICKISNYTVLPVKYVKANGIGKLTLMCSRQRLNKLAELTSTYKSSYLNLHY